MVRTNPERQTALLDAAIELLAQRGARGVGYRALDTQARVPIGTAPHYFRNRTELFRRLAPRCPWSATGGATTAAPSPVAATATATATP